MSPVGQSFNILTNFTNEFPLAQTICLWVGIESGIAYQDMNEHEYMTQNTSVENNGGISRIARSIDLETASCLPWKQGRHFRQNTKTFFLFSQNSQDTQLSLHLGSDEMASAKEAGRRM